MLITALQLAFEALEKTFLTGPGYRWTNIRR